MFDALTTKLALKKVGLPTNTFSGANLPSMPNMPNMPAMPNINFSAPWSSGTSTSNAKPNNSPSAAVDPAIKDPSGVSNQNNKRFNNPFANASNPFANASNPFANTNIALPKALQSWGTPTPPVEGLAPLPQVGSKAPSHENLRFPSMDGKPSLVVFLRHCGCPFAERTLLTARTIANRYPSLTVYIISHCTPEATNKWISSIGGAWSMKVIVDQEREVYASWGLGLGTTWYLMNPWTPVEMRKLGNAEGIWARDVGEGGNRWQMGGYWVVDERGVVRVGGRLETPQEKADLDGAVGVLGFR